MSQTKSLSEVTVSEAAELLAKRAAVVRLVKAAGLLKQSDLGSLMGQAGNWLKANPIPTGAIAGAGLGGLAGGVLGDTPDEDGKRHPWSGALTGALAGGALGGGAGMAATGINSIATPTATEKSLAQFQQDRAAAGYGPGNELIHKQIAPMLWKGLKSRWFEYPLAGSLASKGYNFLRRNAGKAYNRITDPDVLGRGFMSQTSSVKAPKPVKGAPTPAVNPVGDAAKLVDIGRTRSPELHQMLVKSLLKSKEKGFQYAPPEWNPNNIGPPPDPRVAMNQALDNAGPSVLSRWRARMGLTPVTNSQKMKDLLAKVPDADLPYVDKAMRGNLYGMTGNRVGRDLVQPGIEQAVAKAGPDAVARARPWDVRGMLGGEVNKLDTAAPWFSGEGKFNAGMRSLPVTLPLAGLLWGGQGASDPGADARAYANWLRDKNLQEAYPDAYSK